MNPAFLGDSYDLVKRFFVQELRSLGYMVEVDPLFTGDWAGTEDAFHRLIGATQYHAQTAPKDQSALFIDPDTGIREKASRCHVSFKRIAEETNKFVLVSAFDQSFSRQGNPLATMQLKIKALAELGVSALYYNSHARFLFASRQAARIAELRVHLHKVGIPTARLVSGDA